MQRALAELPEFPLRLGVDGCDPGFGVDHKVLHGAVGSLLPRDSYWKQIKHVYLRLLYVPGDVSNLCLRLRWQA